MSLDLLQILGIAINRHQLHALNLAVGHPINGVTARSADTDNFYFGHDGIKIFNIFLILAGNPVLKKGESTPPPSAPARTKPQTVLNDGSRSRPSKFCGNPSLTGNFNSFLANSTILASFAPPPFKTTPAGKEQDGEIFFNS